MPRDYYEILGVARDASDQEIKKAFRGLARELHPDVNDHDPQAEEKFKEAGEAFEVLSDAERRRTFDQYGHEGLRSGGFQPHANAGFGSIEDLFGAIFGGAGGGGASFGFGRQGPAAGDDVGARVQVDLDEVLSGTTTEVSFEAVTTCEHCRGNGAEPGTPIHTCERCGGQGALRAVSRSAFGQVVRTVACDVCHGDGKVPETPCNACSGRGRVAGRRSFDVQIPAGIKTGQRVRITGGGHAGEVGAQSGDLYVEVEVLPDDRFQRDGDDLISVVDVSATAAMVGTTLSVETLEGEREVEIAAGTQPASESILRGSGLPRLGGGRRGDQRVIFNVVVPRALSSEQRRLAGELEETIGPENLKPGSGDGLFSRVKRAFG